MSGMQSSQAASRADATPLRAPAQDQPALQRLFGIGTVAFPSWVALGLVAVSVGVSLLEYQAGWRASLPFLSLFLNPAAQLPLPGAGAIAQYIVLLRLQPRLLPWPQRRLPYLLAIFLLALAILALRQPSVRLLTHIAAYGVAAHARVALGKQGGRLVAAALVLGFLPATLLAQIVPSLHGLPGTTPLQFGIWLAGLLFVDTFTGLGVEERAARLHSEGLVQELHAAQAQLRAYAMHAEELATMRERARLAREIHDTLAQGLAAITMHLEAGAALFDGEPGRARHELERARDIARERLRETRASVLALRASALETQTLAGALAELAAAWLPWDGDGAGQASFRGDTAACERRFHAAVELACYRVAQEALHNAARHGQARRVEVELSVEPDGLCLTVTDDGSGFEPAAVRPRADGGFGLIGMRERVELLGGRLDVLSAPGAGTQIVAMLPLPAAQEGAT